VGSSSFFESRFGSLDQSTHRVGGAGFQYLRIKRNPISLSHSDHFERIIVVPNSEESMNLVILIPKADTPKFEGGMMLQAIRSTLAGIQGADDEGSHQTFKQLWLPQFKVQTESPEPALSNFQVAPNAFLHTVVNQFALELYGPPLSEGVLRVDFDPSAPQDMIVERDFYVAVTHTAIEDTLEVPLACAFVSSEHHWRRA
jgi:hypothetical protein